MEYHQPDDLFPAVLAALPLGVIVIDPGYRVLLVSRAARRLLGVADLRPGMDLLHALHGVPGIDYADLRGAIDAVARNRQPVARAPVAAHSINGAVAQALQLTCLPLRLNNAQEAFVAVTISDVTDMIQATRERERLQAEQDALLRSVRSLEAQVQTMEPMLQEARNDVQDAQSERQAALDEIYGLGMEWAIITEHTHAIMDQLEATNAALLGVNHDLEATNADLSHRATMLQELLSRMDRECDLLGASIQAAPLPTLVLSGPDLRLEQWSDHYARLGADTALLGQPLDVVADRLQVSRRLVALAQVVVQTGHALSSLEHPDGSPGTLAPLRDRDGVIVGVVMYSPIDEAAA